MRAAIALAFEAPSAAAVFDDPALRPGGDHDLGFGERRDRLARVLAGPRAAPHRLLRAYAALGAVEGMVAAVGGAVGLLHVGADRVLKYGVKYDHDPAVTHLGIHGRRAATPTGSG